MLPPNNPALEDGDDWIALGNPNTIPEASAKGFVLQGNKFFAIKKQGKIFLYRNSCPHLGIPLEWVEDQFLDASNSMIQCANHGALFVIESGKCVSGPCSGQKLLAIPYQICNENLLILRKELN